MNSIGIRHEDKYTTETRTPLIPKHVGRLIKENNIKVTIQSSPKRVFSDDEYIKEGATVKSDLKESNIILGIKEVPIESIEKDKTYILFSHIIKGQPYNMPMLKKFMEYNCNIIDYEKVTDEQGRRLIFFGRYAGLAGMINSLWSLGLRLEHLGYKTPFLKIKQASKYKSLNDAKKDISEAGRIIAENGIHPDLRPFVIGFTGYGNVSSGAQEICSLLPIKEILPEELAKLNDVKQIENVLYKVVFREEHLSDHKELNEEFDLADYYRNPHNYNNKFDKYLPHLSMLINGMYWDPRFPRIITKKLIRTHCNEGKNKLLVVGDISCDIEGGIEFTVKATSIDDPIFVYNPENQEIEMGHKGLGILVMSVDILPSELPREASSGFSDVLLGYVKSVAEADFDVPFSQIKIPSALKRAMILHKGKLTHDYKYISEYLK